MRDLTCGVDASIGAPGALHQDRRAVEHGAGVFQRALYGRLVVLTLPAIEGPAVIFDQEADTLAHAGAVKAFG